jgi:hypothetical protein
MKNLSKPVTLGALFIIVLMLTFRMTPVSAEESAQPVDPSKALDGMEAAYAKVNDYTANFLKRERVKGELLPEENILLKFKKPFMVYMKWQEGPHEGREALYVQGMYDNKVVGHEGGFISFITLKMDSKGGTAMKGNRHPITDVGIGRLIGIIMENLRRGEKEGEAKLTFAGGESVFDREAYHIIGDLPPEEEKGYYCKRIEVWVDKGLGLPVKLIIYGWKDEVLERYGYKDLKLNPGLPDSEFDKKNKDYDF